MMPASNNGAGMNMGFPDVCLTPAAPAPIPIPYPNMGQNCMSSVFSPNVYTGFMPALNMASIKPMTQGDNAGAAHPLFMQMGGQTMGNPIIFVNCVPAKNLLVPTFGNAFNNPVGATLVPSVTTTFYTDKATSHAREASLDGDSYTALRDALDCDTVAGGPVVELRPLGDGVAHLIVRRFVRDTDRRVFNLLRGRELRLLLLDLRGNPGGDAGAAFELADDFLPRRTLMATRVERGDEHEQRSRNGQSYAWPTLVLVNARTASAAELLAGALQMNQRATVVGRATAGKGSAQQVQGQHGEDGVSYRTVAEFLLPDGARLHGRGITPDVVVDAESDVLAAALSVGAQRLSR
jgi:carboxyl-terminal processing protease